MVTARKNAMIHVVDDEPDVAATLAEELNEMGYLAIAYTQAARIMASRGDIVVLDHHLELGDRLSCSEEDVYIIKMSGDRSIEPDLIKPFDIQQLIDLIDNASRTAA